MVCHMLSPPLNVHIMCLYLFKCQRRKQERIASHHSLIAKNSTVMMDPHLLMMQISCPIWLHPLASQVQAKIFQRWIEPLRVFQVVMYSV